MAPSTTQPTPPARRTAWSLLPGTGGPPPLPAQSPTPPAHPPSRRPAALPLAAVLVGAGLLLAVAGTATRRSAPDLTRQRTSIEVQIDAGEKEVAGLQAARARLRQQISTADRAAAAVAASSAAMAAAVTRLGPSTGATAVTGPGLTVRLDDPAGVNPAQRITDSDLVQVANVLWAAGAEAVAVDDIRLTARTAIRSAGDAILVNLRPLSPPYAVTAIGAPDALATGFATSAIAARLRTAAAVYGSSVSVRTIDQLSLPAARGLGTSRARPGTDAAAGTGGSP